MIQINLSSSQPIYEQIVKQYKFMLLREYLKPGDAIPSVRKLALELSITPGTVAKAYQELERSGMIETIRGKGTYIANSAMSEPAEGDIAYAKKQLSSICMELMYLGYKKKMILDVVEEFCDSILKGENND